MSALSFAAFASKLPYVNDAKCHKRIVDDVAIVDSSLRFINDLLGSMIDLHRASDRKLQVCIVLQRIDQQACSAESKINFVDVYFRLLLPLRIYSETCSSQCKAYSKQSWVLWKLM